MSYHGLSNWPPVWTWRGGARGDGHPLGEVGTLREVFLSHVDPRSRLYVIIEHDGEEYMGALLFDDETFCRQIYELLSRQPGSRILDIGNLEAGHLA